ncbi:hypothetical protein AB4Y64_09710 [Lysobacter sp. TAF61]|uniref:hypothetical protein n=1 Tax=Lysobacter sp. TAF61 TaxID=3233072 RepID=UPI003F9EA222
MLKALLIAAAIFFALGFAGARWHTRRAARRRLGRAYLGDAAGFTLRAPRGPQAVRREAAAVAGGAP